MSTKVVCISPCVPSAIQQFRAPFMGPIKAGGNLSLKGGCDGCELSVNLFLQIQPFLISLGIPMCLLKCLGKVIKVVIDLKDILTDLPAPNISPIMKDMAKIPTQAGCLCLINLLLPTGICVFVILVRDVLLVIISLINCLISLLTHLLTLTLRVAIMAADPSTEIQSASVCLNAVCAAHKSTLIARFDAVSVLFEALEAVFTFIEALAPLPEGAKFLTLMAYFTSFSGSVSTPTPPGADAIIELLTTLKHNLENRAPGDEAPAGGALYYINPLAEACAASQGFDLLSPPLTVL